MINILSYVFTTLKVSKYAERMFKSLNIRTFMLNFVFIILSTFDSLGQPIIGYIVYNDT